MPQGFTLPSGYVFDINMLKPSDAVVMDQNSPCPDYASQCPLIQYWLGVACLPRQRWCAEFSQMPCLEGHNSIYIITTEWCFQSCFIPDLADRQHLYTMTMMDIKGKTHWGGSVCPALHGDLFMSKATVWANGRCIVTGCNTCCHSCCCWRCGVMIMHNHYLIMHNCLRIHIWLR